VCVRAALYQKNRGEEMRQHSIEWSDRIVLSCSCGERVVLLGRATDWHDESRLSFPCECGTGLTLDDQVPESGRVNPIVPTF
jgi:hypothetical protein